MLLEQNGVLKEPNYASVRFEVLTAGTMRNTLFSKVTLCILVVLLSEFLEEEKIIEKGENLI
jgi:hypothetical protein